MSGFSALPTSKARERRLEVILPGIEQPVPVLVRAVSAYDESGAVGYAIAAAKAKDALPEPGDDVYDAAHWAAVVAAAYYDIDSPENDRKAFFDGGAEQVLRRLPVDSIAYLFQEQQRFQEEVSPNFKAKTPGELVESVRRLAEKDGDAFFSRCSPSTQLLCARFMAGLLTRSRDTSWLVSSPEDRSTPTESKKPSPLARPKPKLQSARKTPRTPTTTT